mmetsp:Transcript_11174/g.25619  ORF Transcript_11174/g.25619 Transcript_11174/m.25619 type:complete len:473 (-) Transcript_11174:2-1420(-)
MSVSKWLLQQAIGSKERCEAEPRWSSRPEPVCLALGDTGAMPKYPKDQAESHSFPRKEGEKMLFWAIRGDSRFDEHTAPQVQQQPAARSSRSAAVSSAAAAPKTSTSVFLQHAAAAAASAVTVDPSPAKRKGVTVYNLCSCDGLGREASDMEVTLPQLPVMPMTTAEQRWMWREFLHETVARTQVTDLYAHFDVEADPPAYRRPPPSVNPSSQLQQLPSPRPGPSAAHVAGGGGGGGGAASGSASHCAVPVEAASAAAIATEKSQQKLLRPDEILPNVEGGSSAQSQMLSPANPAATFLALSEGREDDADTDDSGRRRRGPQMLRRASGDEDENNDIWEWDGDVLDDAQRRPPRPDVPNESTTDCTTVAAIPKDPLQVELPSEGECTQEPPQITNGDSDEVATTSTTAATAAAGTSLPNPPEEPLQGVAAAAEEAEGAGGKGTTNDNCNSQLEQQLIDALDRQKITRLKIET